jgi:tRNA-modifying protein YgfZ
MFVVERVPRAVFRVTGARPLSYLHDVVAQDVAELGPGRGAIAAVLTAGGRVAAEVRVLPLEDSVLLDAEEAARPGIEEHIARHAGLAGCEVTDVSWAVAALRGNDVDQRLAAAALSVPSSEEASFAAENGVLVVRVVWGGPGLDLIGPPEAVADAVAKLDAPHEDLARLDRELILAGRPRYGVDVTEDLLVNETPLLVHGVSMTKGCYPGQESVARINNLGRVRRALRGLRSSAVLTPGARVEFAGAPAGTITGVAEQPGRGSVAIALLAAEIEAGSTVRIDGSDAVVEQLR